jgi:A/G-specific adenine glycosylase
VARPITEVVLSAPAVPVSAPAVPVSVPATSSDARSSVGGALASANVPTPSITPPGSIADKQVSPTHPPQHAPISSDGPTKNGSPLDPAALIRFFDESARKLPWREPSATPWAVLVSEVMLQQTPVVRVLPVYAHWLQRWPAPADLAADSAADAIRAWGRLGYPRRAMRLHAAATAITVGHGGVVPDTVPELLALPGIGEYTARAVAAFAFGARTPVVDTNVRRVVSRVVRGVDEPREPATRADRDLLESLLPPEPAVAARFSAAVMELGATVCTARAPSCGSCALAAGCRWRLAGSPAGSARRPVQTWHGTDRQMRGRMIAVLRDSVGAVPESALTRVVDDAEQGARCLASLLADGLVVRVGPDLIDLPA